MKTGDEVYIKRFGEKALRFAWDGIGTSDLVPLKPTDRLVSELPEIARMTGCYVAVDEGGNIFISYNELEYNPEHDGEGCWSNIDTYMLNVTCPNCERFDRQWGPDGEVL